MSSSYYPWPGPSAWDRPSAGRQNSKYLAVNGLRVKYLGTAKNGERDAASCRADRPCPANVGLYYFEVEVLSKGQYGFIGVGFTAADVNLAKLPGWEKHSYGYHGDDGNAFHGSGSGRQYGPTYSTGDVIGALLNRAERTICYFKNGISLGVAFSNIEEDVLYPVVGLRTPDEEVCANFGHSAFCADFHEMLGEAVARMRRQILQKDVYAVGRNVKTIQAISADLIFSYLRGHFCQTAAVVARTVLGNPGAMSAACLREAEARKAILDALLKGDVDRAVREAESLAPGVFARHPRILFRLQSQKFMQMVLAKKDEAAMEFGRCTLAPAAKAANDQDFLQDVLTLLAYNDPSASPCAYLLGVPAKEELANEVIKAILENAGLQPQAPLERILRQLHIVHAELKKLGNGGACLLDPSDMMASDGSDVYD